MHAKNIRYGGASLGEGKSALILIHGRGATADDIMDLAGHLSVDGFSLLAPQATNYSWYPLSFLAPVEKNEPWLSSAIDLIDKTVRLVKESGLDDDRIFFAGFSQGACLTLEYAARRARAWGGVVAFTGGLIGDHVDEKKYQGDFASTPVFLGTSDPDTHVPVDRVRASTALLRSMNASVMEKVYTGIGHTITMEEIREADEWVFRKAKRLST